MAKLSTTQLREELRNARNATRQSEDGSPDPTSGNTDGVGQKYYRSKRSIPEDISGHSAQNYYRNGDNNSAERSIDEVAVGKRSADRRSSSSNSGEPGSGESSSSTTGVTSRGIRRKGRLIADDPIPIRNEEEQQTGKESDQEHTVKVSRGKGRPRKEKAEVVNVQSREAAIETGEERKQGFEFPKFFKEGTRLSTQEATLLEEPFILGMETYFQYFDEYIRYATHDTQQTIIWSDLDKEDCTALAQVLLKWGQHNELVASGVRAAVNTGDYITVLTLLVPRTIKTVDQFKKAPKIKKPSYFERKRMIHDQI